MSSRREQRPDSDTDMEVGDIQPSQSAELAYDPDQEPEEKRQVRAQYRRLLGEQIGKLERVSRVSSSIDSESLAFMNRTSHGFEQPHCGTTFEDSKAG
jgi:hypothetical protein